MPGEADQEFGDPSGYPYLTIASPSCHDTSTTRAWYQEDKERRQRFYGQVPFSPTFNIGIRFAAVSAEGLEDSNKGVYVHHGWMFS